VLRFPLGKKSKVLPCLLLPRHRITMPRITGEPVGILVLLGGGQPSVATDDPLGGLKLDLPLTG
jgi:hypothetical protein